MGSFVRGERAEAPSASCCWVRRGARRAFPPGRDAAVSSGRVHCHPEPEPPFGGASPAPLSAGRSSATGASLLLGKVKPGRSPADPTVGLFVSPPAALRRSQGMSGGSERSSQPRGDGRRGRRAFGGARRNRCVAGPTLAALRRLGTGERSRARCRAAAGKRC